MKPNLKKPAGILFIFAMLAISTFIFTTAVSAGYDISFTTSQGNSEEVDVAVEASGTDIGGTIDMVKVVSTSTSLATPTVVPDEPVTGKVERGTWVIFVASPTDGYRVSKWEIVGTNNSNTPPALIAGNKTNYFSMSISEDTTVRVTFEPGPQPVVAMGKDGVGNNRVAFDLTNETMNFLGGFSAAIYSLNAGDRWRESKNIGRMFDNLNIPRFINKIKGKNGMTLWMHPDPKTSRKKDWKALDKTNPTIVKFDKIMRRPKRPSLRVNYTWGEKRTASRTSTGSPSNLPARSDHTGTPTSIGTWILADSNAVNTSATPYFSATDSNLRDVLIGMAAEGGKGNIVDASVGYEYYGYGRYDADLGIPLRANEGVVTHTNKQNAVVDKYLIRWAAVREGTGTNLVYTPNSVTRQVRVSSELPVLTRYNQKSMRSVAGGSASIAIAKRTMYQVIDQGIAQGEHLTTQKNSVDVPAGGSIEIWTPASSKRPASAKITLNASGSSN